MPPGIRVDWFRVLVDLDRAGFPLSDVADQAEIPRTTMLGWQQGREPRHADGETLLSFWAAACSKSRDEVPMTEDYPSANGRRY